MKGKDAELSFEQSMSRLDEIVQSLDSGELALNESMVVFEEGVKLTRECSKQLTKAQGRLDILIKKADGNNSLKALDIQ